MGLCDSEELILVCVEVVRAYIENNNYDDIEQNSIRPVKSTYSLKLRFPYGQYIMIFCFYEHLAHRPRVRKCHDNVKKACRFIDDS